MRLTGSKQLGKFRRTLYLPKRKILQDLGGLNISDPDVLAYINSVEIADGQSLEEYIKIAINDFVVACKNDNSWNAIKSCCILAGARTLNGALIPLKGSAPTNNGFTNLDYSRQLGLIGADGKYLDSNRATNTLGTNNGFLFVFVSDLSSNYSLDRGYIGSVVNPNSDISMIKRLANTQTVEYYLNSPFGADGSIGVAGGRGVARTSGNQLIRIQNSNASTSNSPSYTHNNLNIYIHCINSNGSPSLYAVNERIAFYMISDYISNPQIFSARVNTLLAGFNSN